MVGRVLGAGEILVTLCDDGELHAKLDPSQRASPTFTTELVSKDLAALFAYAQQWSAAEQREDGSDLTFSAMLAAMVACDPPICRWLEGHFRDRAVKPERITKARTYDTAELYPRRSSGALHLLTTNSFRTALGVARELWKGADEGVALDVRHFMAAYPICSNYHLADFQRFNVDRREWCVQLSDYLAEQAPAAERASWKLYRERAEPLLQARFDADSASGPDLLGLDREVEAFGRLIAARDTQTPVSIGVFGAWGAGKSYFMHRVHERVSDLAATERQTGKTPNHGRIAQVEFNAWHYSEGALIASLVDHIFRNLRIDAEDDDEIALRRRRAEVMSLLDVAGRDLDATNRALDNAVQRHRRAEDELARLDALLPAEVAAARVSLEAARRHQGEAEATLDKALLARADAVASASARAPVFALAGVVLDGLAEGSFATAAKELIGLADDARTIASRWKLVLIGAVLVLIAGVVGLVVMTEVYARILAAVPALLGLVSLCGLWLAKVNRLAERGRRFQVETDRIANTSRARIGAARAGDIAARQAVVTASRAERATAEETLQALEKKSGDTEFKVKEFRERRVKAEAERANAMALIEHRTAELEQLSTSTLLGELIGDRARATTYGETLTIVSRVRSDIERLSRLIERATTEHAQGKAAEPPVTRIVLYIDDLDRCTEDKVRAVLQAVHLLLAFPLFVCVVAVDPRWLTTCLANAPGVGGDATGIEAALGQRARPADYLEKIFQVPLWLRPVDGYRRSAILRALLGTSQRSVPGQTLAITDLELQFIDRLERLLDGKPRSLKRFANSYRLLKTSLSDVELMTFTSERKVSLDTSSNYYAPYRVCMTQLAVLTGDRGNALEMVSTFDASKAVEDATVNSWLEQLGNVKGFVDLAKDTRAALSPSEEEVARRVRPLATLREFPSREFDRWLERTRRYSFYL